MINKLSLRSTLLAAVTTIIVVPNTYALDADPNAPALNILFLGNSYTAGGRIYERVQTLATEAGWATPYVARQTPGGHQLWEHAFDNPIAEGPSGPGSKWDVVVLQEQSQVPAGDPTFFYDFALDLYDQVQAHNPDAQVVFFQTWARHADWDFSSGYYIGDDPIHMQDLLTGAYNYAAETYIPTLSTAVDKDDVRVAQVGAVDSADYTVWRDNLGATGLDAWAPGDGNGDG